MNHQQSKPPKKPWPTKAAMEQIYEKGLWGDNASQFYSGEGSHLPKLVVPYVAVVKDFLSTFLEPITVLDLGCGDFNVGNEFVQQSKKYIAVDIVSELIEFNKKTFKAANLEFHCLDIATEDLPDADCVLLRQVLQHLSNAEVQRIVEKLACYKYVILTEHLPSGSFTPNAAIISGQGIRLKKQSGIRLSAPPFNLKFVEETHLSTIPLNEGKGVLSTLLYKMF